MYGNHFIMPLFTFFELYLSIMSKNQLKLDLNGLKSFAKTFSSAIEPGILICLYGPIGSGKTTFVQLLGAEIGITEQITSPSFVIINEYYSGHFPVYHFDLYRLEEEGVQSILSELEEYSSDNKALTFVEWAEFSQNKLLEDRLEIYFEYDESFSDTRLISFKAFGLKANTILERLNKNFAYN